MTDPQPERHMPSGLSPSSIDLWDQCPRRFQQEKILGRTGDAGEAAVAGTNVHRALELLMQYPAAERTQELAFQCLKDAWPECEASEDFQSLRLTPSEVLAFRRSAVASIRTYFEIEDPAEVEVVATERFLEAEIQGVPIRGIVDRLDLDWSGNLVVTDYKNGKVPRPQYSGGKIRQLNYYAALVDAIDGRLPRLGRLVFTAHGKTINTSITPSSTESAIQVAVNTWSEVKSAYDSDEFVPKPGPLCGWCPFAAECPEGLADLRDRRYNKKLKKAAPNYDLAAPIEE